MQAVKIVGSFQTVSDRIWLRRKSFATVISLYRGFSASHSHSHRVAAVGSAHTHHTDTHSETTVATASSAGTLKCGYLHAVGVATDKVFSQEHLCAYIAKFL